jgi:hypothetical protein
MAVPKAPTHPPHNHNVSTPPPTRADSDTLTHRVVAHDYFRLDPPAVPV